MPKALEPKTPCRIVLDSDRDKDPQPAFLVETKTYRESQAIVEQLEATKSDREAFEILQPLVAGWQHMGGIEFNLERLPDILTTSEVWELLKKIIANDHVTTEEKKSSE